MPSVRRNPANADQWIDWVFSERRRTGRWDFAGSAVGRRRIPATSRPSAGCAAYYIVHPKEKAQSPVLQAFKGWLKQAIPANAN